MHALFLEVRQFLFIVRVLLITLALSTAAHACNANTMMDWIRAACWGMRSHWCGHMRECAELSCACHVRHAWAPAIILEAREH